MYSKYNDNIKDLIIVDRNNNNELADLFTSSAQIKRAINGEFNLTFTAPKQELKTEYLKGGSVVADNQTFDIVLVEKSHNKSGSITYTCSANHVFWRLLKKNTTTINYAKYGTPTEILTDLLQGTDFTVGQVDFNDPITFAVNQDLTTGSKIFGLVNVLGAEIEYTDKGFTINILNTIGKNNGFEIRLGKNIKSIKEVYDEMQEPFTSYQVNILELKNSTEYIEKGLRDLEVIEIGDEVYLIDEDLDINTTQRIVSIEYDPRFRKNTKLEIANKIKGIIDEIIKIESEAINKNKTYYGIKINPNVGFEVERSDKLAKATFNADEFRMQTGDGLGGYVDSIYFDPIEQVYKFTGTLEATDIIGGSITGSTITGNDISGNTITGGSISIGSNFSVDNGGNMYANNGEFRGDITGSNISGTNFTGGSINIGSNFSVDSGGNMYANNGEFRGDITGSNITGSSITSNSNINVNTNAYIGNRLYLSAGFGDPGIYFPGISGDITITADPFGAIDFNGANIYENFKRVATINYAVEDNVEQGIRLQVFGGRLEFYSPSTGWTTLANLNDIA